MAYSRIKLMCMNCDLHFIICTNYPELVPIDVVSCPQCATNGNCIECKEVADGDVDDEVPGKSKYTALGRNVEVIRRENSSLETIRLKSTDQ